jgi:hypothetical protein
VLAVALTAEETENGFVSMELRTPLVLENLTCSELHYKLFAHEEYKCSGRINAGLEEGLLTVGEWESLEQATLSLSLHLSGWEPAHLALVPAPDGSERRSTLRLLDQHNRPLILEASVVLGGSGSNAALRVSVWAKFVLLNRTPLPLLFRQFKRTAELTGRSLQLAAGQKLEVRVVQRGKVRVSNRAVCRTRRRTYRRLGRMPTTRRARRRETRSGAPRPRCIAWYAYLHA